jgi:N-acetyl-anhydromuramyl-L-alanine amidase AmpD
MNNPKKIIIHHYGGVNSTQHFTAEDVDAWHALRWPNFTSKQFRNEKGALYHVGYHYVVEASGKVVQCRGHDEEGAHCIGMNRSSIGICVAGSFDYGLDKPTKEQQDAVVKLYTKLKYHFPHLTVEDVEPHRFYATKTCWGSSLPDDYWRGIIKSNIDTSDEQEKSEMKKTVEQLTRILALLTQLASLKRLTIKEKL